MAEHSPSRRGSRGPRACSALGGIVNHRAAADRRWNLVEFVGISPTNSSTLEQPVEQITSAAIPIAFSGLRLTIPRSAGSNRSDSLAFRNHDLREDSSARLRFFRP